ncbi:MAG: invasion associated locus B family protein [Rhodobacteraceae bacterium]|nr:invasion associated locus B family protein [Paracoccaceae bacterium]
MFDLFRPLALTATLVGAMALPSAAQETAPAAGTDTAAGTDKAQIAEPYVKNTYGDWQLRCIKAQDGSDPCELYQLLKDDKGTSVAEISMVALPDGEQAVAGATLTVPLETLLPKQLQLAIDANKPKYYPFLFCAAAGCFARIGFTADEIASMKKGSKATVSVVPIAAPDKVVSVDISLKGFTDAFEAVKAERPKP